MSWLDLEPSTDTPWLATTGDEDQDLRNTLEYLRSVSGGGTVFIPQSWVDRNPALAQGVQELDWLQIEKPRGQQ